MAQPIMFEELEKIVTEIIQNPGQNSDLLLKSLIGKLEQILDSPEKLNGFLSTIGLISDANGSGNACKGVLTVGKLCLGLIRSLFPYRVMNMLHQSLLQVLNAGAKMDAEINFDVEKGVLSTRINIDASNVRTHDAAHTSSEPSS